jgi:hypothetical protein
MMSRKMLRHAPPNPQELRKVRVHPTSSPSLQVRRTLPSRIPFLLLPLLKGTKGKDLIMKDSGESKFSEPVAEETATDFDPFGAAATLSS